MTYFPLATVETKKSPAEAGDVQLHPNLPLHPWEAPKRKLSQRLQLRFLGLPVQISGHPLQRLVEHLGPDLSCTR